MWVMLAPDRQTALRRIVRDSAGRPLRRIEFRRRRPVEITDEELSAVSGDLGGALIEVTRDPKGRPRPARNGRTAAPPAISTGRRRRRNQDQE